MLNAAHRHLIHPLLLAKTVAAESSCHPDRVNKRSGATGLGQILLSGSANRGNHTPDELLDVELNLDLTARHLAWCLTLCGDRPLAAISVYNGNSKCRPTEWSYWVLFGLMRAQLKSRRI